MMKRPDSRKLISRTVNNGNALTFRPTIGTVRKITAGAWRKELVSLQAAYEKSTTPYAEVVTDLACVEVLQHNGKDLDRMLENEIHKRTAHKDRDITI